MVSARPTSFVSGWVICMPFTKQNRYFCLWMAPQTASIGTALSFWSCSLVTRVRFGRRTSMIGE